MSETLTPVPEKPAQAQSSLKVVWGVLLLAVGLTAVPIVCAMTKARKSTATTGATPLAPKEEEALIQQKEKEYDDFGGMKGFDGSAYIRVAQAHARTLASDAQLVGIDAKTVTAEGKVMVNAGAGELFYRFRAPLLSDGCMQVVAVRESGLSWSVPKSRAVDCAQPLVQLPRCSLKQVWERAVGASGRPGGRVQINYQSVASDIRKHRATRLHLPPPEPVGTDPNEIGEGIWFVEYRTADKMPVAMELKDDCGEQSATQPASQPATQPASQPSGMR